MLDRVLGFLRWRLRWGRRRGAHLGCRHGAARWQRRWRSRILRLTWQRWPTTFRTLSSSWERILKEIWTFFGRASKTFRWIFEIWSFIGRIIEVDVNGRGITRRVLKSIIKLELQISDGLNDKKVEVSKYFSFNMLSCKDSLWAF